MPSKIFEYAALGKPILAGVGGFAARFIGEELTNAAVFEPGDVDGAIDALRLLHIGTKPRTEFVERYRRSRISSSMAGDILSLVDPSCE